VSEFACESAYRGEVLLVRVKGYLDRTAGERLQTWFTQALRPQTNRIVFDLTGSPVINSSGMAVLLELITGIIDQRDGRIVICGVSNLTRSSLTAVGLMAMVSEAANESDAIRTVLTD
jgi:anti-anti-sigma factor